MSWFLAAAVVLSWILAGFWTVCAIAALRGLRRVPNLAPLPARTTNSGPDMLPKVTVIVPARNEASAVEACLRSLLAQTIPLEIFTVNDRSTDATGAILDNLAAQPQPPGKVLRVLHVEALPDGWLGKPHAMALAARQAATPWLLFTDADVLFAPEVIERALAEAEPHADHLVLMPTLILHSGGERMMTAFFQSLSLIWWRPWRVADPRARESIGIGAFNLIRAGVYRAVGGFEAQRYQVLDDVRLGVEVKRAGFRQRVVFGLDLIRVHWAPGALGMARNLTKNLYAGFSFSPLLLLGVCLGLALLCYGPLLDLAVPWTRYGSALRAAGVVSVVMVALHYRLASLQPDSPRLRPHHAARRGSGALCHAALDDRDRCPRRHRLEGHVLSPARTAPEGGTAAVSRGIQSTGMEKAPKSENRGSRGAPGLKERGRDAAGDLKRINRAADRLNSEARDVLEDQAQEPFAPGHTARR